MPNVIVKEDHFTYGGLDYFRGHAEEIEIGSVGEKRSAGKKPNYLEVKDRILVPEKDVVKATTVEIDFSKSSEKAFNLGIRALIKGVPAELGGDVSFQRLKAGELKLIKFSVLNNTMKRLINKSPEMIQDLINWGDKARIVHQVFIITEASLANQVGNNFNANISAGVDGLKVELGGSGTSSGVTAVTISKGTCFAYLLAKIEWDSNQKKKKTKIEDLNDDQSGTG